MPYEAPPVVGWAQDAFGLPAGLARRARGPLVWPLQPQLSLVTLPMSHDRATTRGLTVGLPPGRAKLEVRIRARPSWVDLRQPPEFSNASVLASPVMTLLR
jgi:hypothetical protein